MTKFPPSPAARANHYEQNQNSTTPRDPHQHCVFAPTHPQIHSGVKRAKKHQPQRRRRVGSQLRRQPELITSHSPLFSMHNNNITPRPSYRALQSTLGVGSRVLINGGNKRHYNKRGTVIECRNTVVIVKLDDTAEAISPCLPDIEVTESDHSRAALAAAQAPRLPEPTAGELQADAIAFGKFLEGFTVKTA